MKNLQNSKIGKLIAFVALILLLQKSTAFAQKPSTLFLPARRCFTYPTEQLSTNSIASDNESNVFVTFWDGKVASINLNSAKMQWVNFLGGQIIADVLVDFTNIYVLSRAVLDNEQSTPDQTNITIRSINLQTGITDWQTKVITPKQSDLSTHIFREKLTLVNKDGNLCIINKNTGQIIRQKSLGGNLLASLYFAEDKLVTGTIDKQILLFSLENEQPVSVFSVSSVATAFFLDKTIGILYWGDKAGMLRSVMLQSTNNEKIKKPRWEFRSGAEISQITSTSFGILISSLDNFVYMIAKKNGKLLWKKRLGGRVSTKPLITGDYVFITTNNEPICFVIDLSNGKIVNKFSLAPDNFFINSPLLIKEEFVFPTAKGLLGFSVGRCISDQ
jgi:outer membrane protein assembly factor BamB